MPFPLKHGMRKNRTRTYACWVSMVQRIINPKCHNYPRYGGRGLDLDPRWREFTSFLSDMGEVPDHCSIERINNDKGYWPDNCRWATALEQQANRRTTKFVTLRGETLPQTEWARRIGIPVGVLVYRVQKQWNEDQICSPLSTARRLGKC